MSQAGRHRPPARTVRTRALSSGPGAATSPTLVTSAGSAAPGLGPGRLQTLPRLGQGAGGRVPLGEQRLVARAASGPRVSSLFWPLYRRASEAARRARALPTAAI